MRLKRAFYKKAVAKTSCYIVTVHSSPYCSERGGLHLYANAVDGIYLQSEHHVQYKG